MSHIVQIKTTVRDPVALAEACRRLGLEAPAHGTTKLFSGEVTGLSVALPDWRYPVVFDTHTGRAHFDNYNGAWGDQVQLDRLLQRYAVEKARIETRKAGHSVHEQLLPDGSIKLTVKMGGAA